MEVKLDQIKLAHAVKNGRSEDVLFRDSKDYRSHGHSIEMVAVKMPVENSPGEFVTQPLVKITDKQSNETTYTSLANAIYFKGELIPVVNNVKQKRKATI